MSFNIGEFIEEVKKMRERDKFSFEQNMAPYLATVKFPRTKVDEMIEDWDVSPIAIPLRPNPLAEPLDECIIELEFLMDQEFSVMSKEDVKIMREKISEWLKLIADEPR